MPLPLLLVPWLYTVVGGLVAAGGAKVALSEVKRAADKIGPEAIQAALEKMGLTVDGENPLTDEGMTALINSSFLDGSGIELESVFDREKMRNGFKKLALKRAAEKLGFADVNTEAGLRVALQGWLSSEVIAQMEGEAGDIFDAAKASIQTAKVVEGAVKVEDWNTARDMSEAGIANRARQAKYRHSHKKTWVLRGEA